MVNDVYGVFFKSYEPFTIETKEKVLSGLTNELSDGFEKENLNKEDYEIEVISNKYEENGVIPVWTLALKATPIKGETK